MDQWIIQLSNPHNYFVARCATDAHTYQDVPGGKKSIRQSDINLSTPSKLDIFPTYSTVSGKGV